MRGLELPVKAVGNIIAGTYVPIWILHVSLDYHVAEGPIITHSYVRN